MSVWTLATLKKHSGDMPRAAFESRSHSAQEKRPAQTLMTLPTGSASYDAPCMNCSLLVMLGEMTASVFGLLSDYLFLAAIFSSFSWYSCYFSSSWSGGKAYVVSHLPRVGARQHWLSAYPWNCLDTVMCCQTHKVNKTIGENIFPVNPLSIIVSEVICVSGRYNVFRWRHDLINQLCLSKTF